MRKPNLRAAAADLSFAAIALVGGLVGAPVVYWVALFFAAGFVWAWTRWSSLNAMPLPLLLSNSGLALMLICAVLGVAYWIGLIIGGHT